MKEKIINANGEEVSYVTHFTLENGNVYILYSDGKMYEEITGKGFVEVDNLAEVDKELIAKLMKRLEPIQIDVIDTKNVPEKKDIKIAHEPEL